MATKIRALGQRRKGRDLFDPWLGLTAAALSPEEIAACFGPYRYDGYSPEEAARRLDAHLLDPAFLQDLAPLTANTPDDYAPDLAARLVKDRLLPLT